VVAKLRQINLWIMQHNTTAFMADITAAVMALDASSAPGGTTAGHDGSENSEHLLGRAKTDDTDANCAATSILYHSSL
jgi:hypothetical protein